MQTKFFFLRMFHFLRNNFLLFKKKKIAWKNPSLFFFFFCDPQLYLWGSPFLGEIFAYVTIV